MQLEGALVSHITRIKVLSSRLTLLLGTGLFVLDSVLTTPGQGNLPLVQLAGRSRKMAIHIHYRL